ncbi:hypothetical protein Q3W71_28130 [Micromonospora sp. C28SCA-DRY-2]|uniref:hypothetical protein n=1 Tax=Micromonospora sp. C28SCA-DRY-2 TaxID=3059522 RepID=UPI0026748711|nr:hypothetical protein [Micromonospora sp. C28SCA-DRY-2]MDO3705543.1 hypothetical protein [Micromonospora sp. C28SCA-DRY-2]
MLLQHRAVPAVTRRVSRMDSSTPRIGRDGWPLNAGPLNVVLPQPAVMPITTQRLVPLTRRSGACYRLSGRLLGR